MATEVPKPAPRKMFTTPVNTLKDEDLYDDDLPGDVEALRSEVNRLRARVAALEKQENQMKEQSELIEKQEREIEEQRRQLEGAKREAQKQQSELKAQEERIKQRDFELEMEKDMHIRRKKAMDEKEFRIREMEDDLQSKIQNFAAATTTQNSSLEELARREEDVGLREVRLRRQEEKLKSFQDELYEREGRLEQNERTLEEKFKNVIAKEQEIKDQMQALELHREEHSAPTTPVVKSATTTIATVSTITTTTTAATANVSDAYTTPPAAISHDQAEVASQREIEEFYRLKREQEELDRLLALQFEQSGFGDDEIPPSISSEAPGNTDTTSGHSALDVANNS